jgi:hypothetical protein
MRIGPRSYNILAAALVFAASLLVLAVGLRAAALDLTLHVDDPRADAYLTEFRELEHNATDAYRWSFPAGAIDLNAFARLPVIADLRMTSPRPADEPAAVMRLSRGPWSSPQFDIRGDWRRYQVLVPVSEVQPELSLEAVSFRPDERDRRSLGVALSRLELSVPAGQPQLPNAIAALGTWRILLLVALPLICYSLAVRAALGRRSAPLLGAVAALPGLALAWLQASDPIDAAFIPPTSWLPAALLVCAIVLWLTLRASLLPIERRLRAILDDGRLRPLVVLAAALLTGSVMLIAMPPWEQPDESSHFEFAWLIANHSTWPTPGTSDPRLASIDGGGRALYHQSLYHTLVSLPLRLATNLDLIQQLYVARSVSLLLFVAIVLMAERTVCTLFAPGHVMRWFVPLTLALNPTFANLMTGVNNDVAVVAACTWAVWGAARMLVAGITAWRIAWLVVSVPIAMLCKNTGAALLVLVPLTLTVAYWSARRWRYRWLLGLAAASILGAGLLSLTWGDPGHWYRWGASSASPAVRAARPEAPLGPHTLRIDAVSVPNFEGLSAPVVDGSRFSGGNVTAGAWIWASRPARIWAPGVIFQGRGGSLSGDYREIEVGTQPRFVAFTYPLPQRLMLVQYMAWGVAPGDTQPLEIYIDGAVFVEGAYSESEVPQFDAGTMKYGTWGGKRFTNLIRNGDAEEAWVYLRPQISQLIERYARRSPARLVASLYDPLTTLYLELRDYLPWMVFTSFGAFGGRIFLRDPIWQFLLPGAALVLSFGVLRSLTRIRRLSAPRRRAFVTLGIAAALVWAAVILAHLPVGFPSGIPSSRYGFTMMLPTMIVAAAGWLALWSRERRATAAALLLGMLAVLSVNAVSTIRLFENTVCVRNPGRCLFTPATQPYAAPVAAAVCVLTLGALIVQLVRIMRHSSAPSEPPPRRSTT